MKGIVELLREEFKQGGWGAIRRLVEERREESIHLEFKEKSSPDRIGMTDDDKKNLASRVSGFANAEGGLIIWGVKGRRGTDGIDCAQEIVPISSIDTFVSRLKSLTPECVTPDLAGVAHFPIREETSEDSGVVVTVIPESATGPHMAISKKVIATTGDVTTRQGRWSTMRLPTCSAGGHDQCSGSE